MGAISDSQNIFHLNFAQRNESEWSAVENGDGLCSVLSHAIRNRVLVVPFGLCDWIPSKRTRIVCVLLIPITLTPPMIIIIIITVKDNGNLVSPYVAPFICDSFHTSNGFGISTSFHIWHSTYPPFDLLTDQIRWKTIFCFFLRFSLFSTVNYTVSVRTYRYTEYITYYYCYPRRDKPPTCKPSSAPAFTTSCISSLLLTIRARTKYNNR